MFRLIHNGFERRACIASLCDSRRKALQTAGLERFSERRPEADSVANDGIAIECDHALVDRLGEFESIFTAGSFYISRGKNTKIRRISGAAILVPELLRDVTGFR